MATQPGRRGLARTGPRRLTTETKASWKTTEFYAMIALIAGILIAAAVVDETDAGGFGARQAWLYVAIVGSAYMISRGLAKSGSREPYWDDNDGHERDRGDRDRV
jgi:hypothetical protein